MFALRFVLAVLAFVNIALAGAPPACLLGAIQRLPNPADLSAVCNKYQSAVTGNLTEVCAGDNVQAAYSAYSATCSLAGVKVKALATATADASSAASGTATGKTTATATGKTTATAKATASTKTGTATATATGASASGTGDSTSGAGMAAASQPVVYMVSGLLALGMANMLL